MFKVIGNGCKGWGKKHHQGQGINRLQCPGRKRLGEEINAGIRTLKAPVYTRELRKNMHMSKGRTQAQ